MKENDTVNNNSTNAGGAGKKRFAPLPKPYIVAPPEGDKSPNFYKLAVAAHLVKPGETRVFARRKLFDRALAESIFDEEAFVSLVKLHRENGWDPLAFVKKGLEILYGENYCSNKKCCKRISPFINFWCENGVDFKAFLNEQLEISNQKIKIACNKLRSALGGEVYTNLVLAVPHAVGKIKFPAIENLEEVKEALLSDTEWYADKLFLIRDKLIKIVKFPYSQLEVDAECSEDDPNRIAAFRLPGKGSYQGEIPPFREYQYRQAWSQYRTDIMEAASRGDKPFLIDCRSFSCTLAPDVDICLGFNWDESRPPSKVLENIFRLFKRKHYKVRRNYPYSGSIVPKGYHGPSLMIAVNKAAYLNLNSQDKYETLQETIRDVYTYLLNNTLLY